MKRLFSEQEIRGLLLFVPLAALAVAALLLAQPRPDTGQAREAEAAVEAEQSTRAAMSPGQRDSLRLAERTFRFHAFDPNTVTYDALYRMGLTAGEANGLIKYRKSGAVFTIPEDVARCYSIPHELYLRMEPYIAIGEAYALKPRAERTYVRRERKLRPLEPFLMDTVSAAFLYDIGVVSWRQAENIVNRHRERTIRNMYELRECYGIDDSIAALLRPYVIFPATEPSTFETKIDINRADSAELCRVKGIGPLTAGRIVAYRTRLGGFVAAEQLAGVEGMTEANYELILKQISCEYYEIRKIDINFADPKELARHPYITDAALRKIVRKRQLKGGWTSAQEMIDDDIFTPEEAARLAPYLQFREKAAEPTDN